MKEPLVISASRRTDLAGCYPEVLRERLREYPPEAVHSLVLWTKNPRNLLVERDLRMAIGDYRQVYVHLTVTGMGGNEFEPRIPPWEETVRMIGPLVEWVKDPRRISWRFDPILEAEGHGERYSNLNLFPRLVEAIAPYGIKTCRVSWVSPYKKVTGRLERKGWHLLPTEPRRRKEQADELVRRAGRYGMEIVFCSMEGFPVSSCIDGALLSALHPEGLACSKEKARGQRPLCGCTRSLDIGWYSLKCQHGCLYCYATP
jgi:DNA repair photolyase